MAPRLKSWSHRLEQDTGVDCRSAAGRSYSCHQFLNGWLQYATGILHENRFYSFHILLQKKNRPCGRLFLEQDTGVEPAFTAWEAVVLPIYESCICVGIIAKENRKFNHILSMYPLQFPPMRDSLKKKQEVFS